jgi:uncharacterized protein DUF6152
VDNAMPRCFATIVATAILGGSSPLLAHHSFAATFDISKPLKLSGTVTAIEWANPHVYFYIDVANEQSGTVVNWAVELLSPNALARNGWSRSSMTVGDKVVVEGSPARDGTRLASARFVTLSATGRRVFDVSGGGSR